MPTRCAVAECVNNSSNKENLPNVSFHRFPIKNKGLLKLWIKACKRKDNFKVNSALVCSDHFTSDSFERDLKNELLNLPLRKLLKPSSIPTLFPNRSKTPTKAQLARRERAKKRENEEVHRQTISDIEASFTTDDSNDAVSHYEEEPEQEEASNNKTEGTQTETVTVCNKGISTALCEPKLHRKIDSLWNLLNRKDKTIAGLKVKVRRLQNKLRLLQTKLQLKEDIAKKSKRFISSSQEKLIMGKKRVNWSAADIVKALSVRSVCLKSYETARRNWGLPLPSTRTLRRHTRNFSCNPGILNEVMVIMQNEATELKPLQRICALSFDEMAINSKIVIDKSTNEFVSGSKAQVVLVRGIFENWKQPIYFNFDEDMNKALLFKISSLEKSGFPVYAITCDLSRENRFCLDTLGIDIGKIELDKPVKTFFENPFDNSRNVHVFADTPHMLKLLRNHVLDDGIKLKDGTIITKDTFQFLITADNTEIKHCPKLCQKLVDVSGPERMRVKYAANLFSHHVACYAKMIYPLNEPIWKFISTIDKGFDVMNSRVPVHPSNKLKSGFGSYLSEQKEALHELREELLNSKFFTKKKNLKKAFLPFQIGWIISIDSTINLFNDLHSKYGIKYILSSRLTQDSLESLFSQIRAYGGPNTSPTVPEFKYRLRLLLVGSHVRPPKLANCDEEFGDCSWISSKLISGNKFVDLPVVAPYQERIQIKENPFQDNSHPSNQLQYLAGYLAFKLQKKGYNYGTSTYKTKGSSWIHSLSRGGLLVPDNEFAQAILKCNECYEKNYNSLKHLGDFKKALVNEIGKVNPTIERIIVEEFVNVRHNIRATYLSRKGTENNVSLRNKRKLKQFTKTGKPTSKKK